MSSNATVDPFLADQILLTAVFAEGETNFKVSRLTQRLLTTIWVVKQFAPIHITVRGSEGSPGQVTIRRG
jgi:RNA 3'-terminal phosphate cyclase (ATP)